MISTRLSLGALCLLALTACEPEREELADVPPPPPSVLENAAVTAPSAPDVSEELAGDEEVAPLPE